MPAKDVVAVLVVVVLWGINFVAVKAGVEAMPPLFGTALRFAIVAAVLCPFYRPRLYHLADIFKVAILLGVCHFGLVFLGIKRVDAATASIVMQLNVPFGVLVGAVFLKERFGWARAFGIALAFVGVAVLAGEPQRPDPLGILLLVGASVAWASSNVLIKVVHLPDPLVLNGWMALCSVPFLLGLSWLFEDGQMAAVRTAGWAGWGGIVYTAVLSSIVAHTLWYWLLERHPINLLVPFNLLVPPIGVASGVLLLGDPFSWQKLAGGLVTIAGVAVIQLRVVNAAGNSAVVRD